MACAIAYPRKESFQCSWNESLPKLAVFLFFLDMVILFSKVTLTLTPQNFICPVLLLLRTKVCTTSHATCYSVNSPVAQCWGAMQHLQ